MDPGGIVYITNQNSDDNFYQIIVKFINANIGFVSLIGHYVVCSIS